MTLTTLVYVLDPVPVEALHAEATRLVNPGDIEVEQRRFESAASGWEDGCARATIRNLAMQGLEALVWTYYGPDGPIGGEGVDEYGNPLHPGFLHMAALAFDTPYAYRTEHGGVCGDQHAWLVEHLGQWLDDRGVRWCWENEDDGSIHHGYDELHLLGKPALAGIP